jgi:hypothetical protein
MARSVPYRNHSRYLRRVVASDNHDTHLATGSNGVRFHRRRFLRAGATCCSVPTLPNAHLALDVADVENSIAWHVALFS